MLNGVNVAIFSFSFWGFVAIYWKQLPMIAPFELLGHRIFWGVVTLVVYLFFTRSFNNLKQCFSSKKVILSLLATSVLIFINWFIFVWAVSSGHVLEASIGYFISPLINVALGVMILKEKLRPKQRVSVFLALVGLIFLISTGVGRPSISLILAMTFGLYGLLRKQINVGALEGLFFEMVVSIVPISFIISSKFSSINSLGFFNVDLKEQILISMAGAVTLIPLISFNYAVQRIKLSTVGILQYISPILQFALAVFVFDEEFSRIHLLSFSFIWIALIIYTFDLLSIGKGKSKNYES